MPRRPFSRLAFAVLALAAAPDVAAASEWGTPKPIAKGRSHPVGIAYGADSAVTAVWSGVKGEDGVCCRGLFLARRSSGRGFSAAVPLTRARDVRDYDFVADALGRFTLAWTEGRFNDPQGLELWVSTGVAGAQPNPPLLLGRADIFSVARGEQGEPLVTWGRWNGEIHVGRIQAATASDHLLAVPGDRTPSLTGVSAATIGNTGRVAWTTKAGGEGNAVGSLSWTALTGNDPPGPPKIVAEEALVEVEGVVRYDAPELIGDASGDWTLLFNKARALDCGSGGCSIAIPWFSLDLDGQGFGPPRTVGVGGATLTADRRGTTYVALVDTLYENDSRVAVYLARRRAGSRDLPRFTRFGTAFEGVVLVPMSRSTALAWDTVVPLYGDRFLESVGVGVWTSPRRSCMASVADNAHSLRLASRSDDRLAAVFQARGRGLALLESRLDSGRPRITGLSLAGGRARGRALRVRLSEAATLSLTVDRLTGKGRRRRETFVRLAPAGSSLIQLPRAARPRGDSPSRLQVVARDCDGGRSRERTITY